MDCSDWKRAYAAVERWHKWEEHHGPFQDCGALQCIETRARCLDGLRSAEAVGRERLHDGGDGQSGGAAADPDDSVQVLLHVFTPSVDLDTWVRSDILHLYHDAAQPRYGGRNNTSNPKESCSDCSPAAAPSDQVGAGRAASDPDVQRSEERHS